ncbi:MAG: hypothetical protein ACK5R1_12390 [Planctomycetota bacterium]
MQRLTDILIGDVYHVVAIQIMTEHFIEVCVGHGSSGEKCRSHLEHAFAGVEIGVIGFDSLLTAPVSVADGTLVQVPLPLGLQL